MKKILITQRIDFLKDRNEVRESIDMNLSKLVLSIGMIPIQCSCKILEKFSINEFLDNLSPDGIILSGGNNIGEYLERDNFEFAMLSWSALNKVPLFGICRGLQILNSFCNGSLAKVEGHCNTRHIIYGVKEFDNLEVNSFHDFGVKNKNLGKNLVVLAQTKDNCIEALKHKTNPWLGIMWHPEREDLFSKNDLAILNSHFN